VDTQLIEEGLVHDDDDDEEEMMKKSRLKSWVAGR